MNRFAGIAIAALMVTQSAMAFDGQAYSPAQSFPDIVRPGLPTLAGPSSLSDLARRAGLGRIGALIRPFLFAGWDAVGQFPHD